MSTALRRDQRKPRAPDQAYVLVLFVVVVAFVAVAAAMQVLVLTSVATTSRAYDEYRQASVELVRIEQAVAETLLEQRQVSVSPCTRSLADSLAAHMADVTAGGAAVLPTSVPATLPTINWFPDAATPPDPLEPLPRDLAPFITPELGMLWGPRVASYPPARFEFTCERPVLETNRTFQVVVRARLVAVPITRFPVSAYDLPSEIGGSGSGAVGSTTLPQGLVPRRDTAFIADLQAQAAVLPYHYRRRAVLSAAYQYLFSQGFVDRIAEYAGPTHFRDLDATAGTAVLSGMSTVDSVTSWDLADAGSGTCGSITAVNDAAVVFTEAAGRTLRLYDTSTRPDRPPLFLLVLGPADVAIGPITVEFSSIARPVVIVAANVRVVAAPGTAVAGALLLDPHSSFAAGTQITIGHLSYWGGTPGMSQVAITSTVMPASAEALAPRVVYVGTQATQL